MTPADGAERKNYVAESHVQNKRLHLPKFEIRMFSGGPKNIILGDQVLDFANTEKITDPIKLRTVLTLRNSCSTLRRERVNLLFSKSIQLESYSP